MPRGPLGNGGLHGLALLDLLRDLVLRAIDMVDCVARLGHRRLGHLPELLLPLRDVSQLLQDRRLAPVHVVRREPRLSHLCLSHLAQLLLTLMQLRQTCVQGLGRLRHSLGVRLRHLPP